MITKNIYAYAEKNWSSFQESITNISKSDEGNSLISSDVEIYNFDKIVASLFEDSKKPSSADAISFQGNKIDLIEFKSGFNQRITKKNFDESKALCPTYKVQCRDYYKVFFDNQKHKTNELIFSIKIKAIESYFIIEKHILPLCEDNEQNKNNFLNLVVVIDGDEMDGYEDILSEVSGNDTDNPYSSLRKSLKRLSNHIDACGKPYYYDDIKVLSATEYKNMVET